MHDDLPHYLRFARALALVGSVTVVGCSSTVAGQDVPAADTQPDSPPPGIAVAPDVPGDQPVMIDAGIAISPDSPSPGISVAPDASAEPDVSVGADA